CLGGKAGLPDLQSCSPTFFIPIPRSKRFMVRRIHIGGHSAPLMRECQMLHRTDRFVHPESEVVVTFWRSHSYPPLPSHPNICFGESGGEGGTTEPLLQHGRSCPRLEDQLARRTVYARDA